MLKKVKAFIGKLVLGWTLVTLVGYAVFPVLAIIMTFGANFYRLIYKDDGTVRAYFSLKPGTPLYANPLKGNVPTWITTGDLIVEQIKMIMPQENYTNAEMYWRDTNYYHRVCLRLGTSPADITAFAANRGCLWLRNKDGEQYEMITTVPILRGEWERLEAMNQNNKSEFALVYPYVLPTVMMIAPYTAIIALALVLMGYLPRPGHRRRPTLKYA